MKSMFWLVVGCTAAYIEAWVVTYLILLWLGVVR